MRDSWRATANHLAWLTSVSQKERRNKVEACLKTLIAVKPLKNAFSNIALLVCLKMVHLSSRFDSRIIELLLDPFCTELEYMNFNR